MEEYKKVVQLCIEGEAVDKDYRGLVKDWKEYRYKAYEMLGEVEEQRQLAKELLFKGEFIYYQELKKLYSSGEWETVLKEILIEFGRQKYQPSAYVSILIQENLTAELLRYFVRIIF